MHLGQSRQLSANVSPLGLRCHSSVIRNADGVGGVIFSSKKRYEGVRFNVISVTRLRGWVGVQFPEKKRYVTFEWPLILPFVSTCVRMKIIIQIQESTEEERE